MLQYTFYIIIFLLEQCSLNILRTFEAFKANYESITNTQGEGEGEDDGEVLDDE